MPTHIFQVLTTYAALRRDLAHEHSVAYHIERRRSNVSSATGVTTPRRGGSRLGGGHLGCIVQSPLTVIRWWRLALDEAQMVDNPTAQASDLIMPFIMGWMSMTVLLQI